MGKSSKDKNDIYYRKAKEEGWRARSAFKLIQIDWKFNILENVTKVVDLCAAPGSWSQVLSRKLYMGEKIGLEPPATPKEIFAFSLTDHTPTKGNNKNVKIVAVDLQPMTPLPGVTQIQGDITKYSTAEEIVNHLEGTKADLVVCDGAPDVTGLHSMDIYVHSQLLLGALHIMCNVLKSGGNFVVKVFHHKSNDMLTKKLLLLFKDVVIVKPPSSRVSSIEAFAVCLNYCPPEGFDSQAITPFLDLSNKNFDSLTGISRTIIPFLVSGDISAWNIDSTKVEEGPKLKHENIPLNPLEHSFLAFKQKSTEEIDAIMKESENRNRMSNNCGSNTHHDTTESSQNKSKDCDILDIPAYTYFFNKQSEGDAGFVDINERFSNLRAQICDEKWNLHKKICNVDDKTLELENKLKKCNISKCA
ncbi:hypothetical protein RI129_011872 [Pyrocoelia pectoralis]|uniref:Putative tRNA (cytidine(32)/guanosine(34)-2'-O)-methyltransferase n=1 Tax=Pyrocoelia pectoralis TaxID=417401 RepID=A0AAN7Z858_9COLE